MVFVIIFLVCNVSPKDTGVFYRWVLAALYDTSTFNLQQTSMGKRINHIVHERNNRLLPEGKKKSALGIFFVVVFFTNAKKA